MPTFEYDIYDLSYSKNMPVAHCYSEKNAKLYMRKGYKVVLKELTDNGWKVVKTYEKK